jgi:plasmid stability protein
LITSIDKYTYDIDLTFMDVLIRNFDPELYRRLKARAAAKGEKIGEALGEATEYLLSKHEVTTEADANNAAYAAAKRELLRKYAEKYVVFCDGTFRGTADDLEGASKIIRAAGRHSALVMKMGEEIPKGGEWLWSSLELFAA